MSRVEPYETGTWKFYCACEYEDVRFGCSRIVNDSEPNFTCEKPIIDSKDQKCKLRHKLAPLIEAWMKFDSEQKAMAFLATMERNKKDAMETLGISEAQLNAVKDPPVTSSSGE